MGGTYCSNEIETLYFSINLDVAIIRFVAQKSDPRACYMHIYYVLMYKQIRTHLLDLPTTGPEKRVHSLPRTDVFEFAYKLTTKRGGR